ncbi:MAG: ATP phosphoribosyltransferase [Firmicutes bacterium]|nr:ATP phosphoribosyltransferase [Bacillota bacterium]
MHHGQAPDLTIALPKGRLTSEAVALLGQVGLDASAAVGASRDLVTLDHGAGVRFLLAKPFDVPTFVAAGAADLGIVGKDVLMEVEPAVVELLDLGIGRCRMQVAVPEGSGVRGVEEMEAPVRVATRYPRATLAYFQSVGLPAQVVRLDGSIELAPRVGLADAIVDLVQTGRTLEANGLVAIATIAEISGRLIANPVRWKLKYDRIARLISEMRGLVPVRPVRGREG